MIHVVPLAIAATLAAQALCSALGETVADGPSTADIRRPNIVLIMADDIGLGDIGCYHRERFGAPPHAPTPTIDALAREGIWFTDAHSPTALCSPSRYAVMSGNNPYRSYAPWGVWGSFRASPLKKSEGTLGSIAKKAGYTTAFIGKWHLGGDFAKRDSDAIYRGQDRGDEPLDVDATRWVAAGPQDWGFDYDFTLPCGVQGPFYVAFENGRWYPLADESQLIHLNDETAIDPIFVSDKGFGTGDSHWDPTKINTLLAHKAVDFIRQSAGDRNFFLCYWTPAVHIPHTPPDQLDGEPIMGQTPSRHLDMVRVFDWEVKQIVEALKETGQYENTLVLVTSDNGGLSDGMAKATGHDSSGVWRGKKNDPHEGGHRVPLVAVWPKVISGGTQTDALVSGTDIFATLGAAAEVPLGDDQGMDSHSFLPLLEGDPDFAPRDELLLQGGSRHELILRQGRWKLIIQSNHLLSKWEPVALFDLVANPQESEGSNLVDHPDHADRVATMLEYYQRVRKASSENTRESS